MSAAEPVLRPLPRATPGPRADVTRPPPRPPRPAPSLRLMASRGSRWGLAMMRLWARTMLDGVRRRQSLARTARHLRAAFEELGGPAVKLGQQLSMRVDLLPFEVCAELGRLTDQAPAFPTEQAIEAIEEAVGGPLASVFAAFDPDPIGSASIACVYKARLHDGQEVAIKVQRPDVAGQFVADIRAFHVWTRTLEMTTLVRPDFFAAMREELRSMFEEELNFVAEARYQSLYLRFARQAGLDWLTCPRVHRRYCNHRVIVSDFVSGVPCSEVLAAVETGDAVAAARLAQNDIDPPEVARRLFYTSLWSRLEAPFFHGDPHPANVIILPGGRVCMIDFGACGTTSRAVASQQLAVFQLIVENRISEAASVMLAQLSPIARLDVDALRRDLEARLWRYAHGLNDKGAPWFDRTSAALWLAMVEATQKYNLPVNRDTLRLIRATLLYDTLAMRIHSKPRLRDSRRYLRDNLRRTARRIRRRARAAGPPGARLLGARRELRPVLSSVLLRLGETLGNVAPHFQQLIGLQSLVGRWVLGQLLLAGVAVLVVVLVGRWIPGAERDVWDALTDPSGALALVTLLCLRARQLQARLVDVKVRSRLAGR